MNHSERRVVLMLSDEEAQAVLEACRVKSTIDLASVEKQRRLCEGLLHLPVYNPGTGLPRDRDMYEAQKTSLTEAFMKAADSYYLSQYISEELEKQGKGK